MNLSKMDWIRIQAAGIWEKILKWWKIQELKNLMIEIKQNKILTDVSIWCIFAESEKLQNFTDREILKSSVTADQLVR